MEEGCARHSDVAGYAIGVIDALNGQAPCGFLVLKRHVSRETAVNESEVIVMIRESIGPVAAFKIAISVNRSPKIRCGKILRGTTQKIADGIFRKMPATIDDPTILEEIAEALRSRSFGSLPM